MRTGVTATYFKFILLLGIIFMASPYAHALGLSATRYWLLSTIGILMAGLTGRKLKMSALTLFALLQTLALGSSIYFERLQILFLSLNLGFSFLLVSTCHPKELEKVVKLSSKLLLLLLILGLIAWCYYLAGGRNYSVYIAPGGRELINFYISLAVHVSTYDGSGIRINGIYDEPGTFSFIVCTICACRHLMGLNKKVTWLLLVLGFITNSLAHFIYVIVHLFAELAKPTKKIVSGLLVMALLILSLSLTTPGQKVVSFLGGRLSTTPNVDRIFEGDNRSAYFINDMHNLMVSGVWDLIFGHGFGQDEAYNKHNGLKKGGFNPLYPIIGAGGILLAWPYYLGLLSPIGLILYSRIFIPTIGISLLWMQRPTIYSSGYSVLFALLNIIVIHTFIKRKLKN